MANADKDILITPNKGQSGLPSISFVGADNTPVTLTVSDDGTISFQNSSGKLFSISPSDLSALFSVSDNSGVPDIEVLSDGTVNIAKYGGKVVSNSYTVRHTELRYPDSVVVDFSQGTGFMTVYADSAISFIGKNYVSGSMRSIRIVSDPNTGNLLFPQGWVFLGERPISNFSDTLSVGVLNLISFGSTESECIASWSTELP